MRVITLARKPLSEGTVVSNVLEYGCGALNIDGTRVGTKQMTESRMSQTADGVYNMNGRDVRHGNWKQKPLVLRAHTGRWPSNVILVEGGNVGRNSRFFKQVEP